MIVAGIYLNDNDLIALAGSLRSEGLLACAQRLEGAYYRDVRMLDLSVEETDDLLVVLRDCPPELTHLRDALGPSSKPSPPGPRNRHAPLGQRRYEVLSFADVSTGRA